MSVLALFTGQATSEGSIGQASPGTGGQLGSAWYGQAVVATKTWVVLAYTSSALPITVTSLPGELEVGSKETSESVPRPEPMTVW